jgi:hypothetical protein
MGSTDAGAILLVGCMADAGNHDQPIVPGYRYHDANHTNGPSGNASPQHHNTAAELRGEFVASTMYESV